MIGRRRETRFIEQKIQRDRERGDIEKKEEG